MRILLAFGGSLVRSASQLCHNQPAKVQRVSLISRDAVHQSGAIRQNSKEIFALTNHLLKLVASSFACGLW